jgi:hypothetical protein
MEKQDLGAFFVSFYSSLQLQLRGKYYVLNCASNFHSVLRTLVKHGGCSFTQPIVYCLNDQHGEFKLCSSGNFDTCSKDKKEQIAHKQQVLAAEAEAQD